MLEQMSKAREEFPEKHKDSVRPGEMERVLGGQTAAWNQMLLYQKLFGEYADRTLKGYKGSGWERVTKAKELEKDFHLSLNTFVGADVNARQACKDLQDLQSKENSLWHNLTPAGIVGGVLVGLLSHNTLSSWMGGGIPGFLTTAVMAIGGIGLGNMAKEWASDYLKTNSSPLAGKGTAKPRVKVSAPALEEAPKGKAPDLEKAKADARDPGVQPARGYQTDSGFSLPALPVVESSAKRAEVGV